MTQHHSRIFIGHPARTLGAKPTRSTSGEDKTGLGIKRAQTPAPKNRGCDYTPDTDCDRSLKNNGDAYEQFLRVA